MKDALLVWDSIPGKVFLSNVSKEQKDVIGGGVMQGPFFAYAGGLARCLEKLELDSPGGGWIINRRGLRLLAYEVCESVQVWP